MTAARGVKLVQEGHADDFFEDVQQPRTNANKSQFVESGIKWQDSKARKILYNDIVKNLIPLEAKDTQNKSTMKLMIYTICTQKNTIGLWCNYTLYRANIAPSFTQTKFKIS